MTILLLPNAVVNVCLYILFIRKLSVISVRLCVGIYNHLQDRANSIIQSKVLHFPLPSEEVIDIINSAFEK